MTAKHVLVAFDFSAPSKHALELARTLRAKLHCAVTVVHVFPDPFADTAHPPKDSIWASSEQMQAHLEAVGEQVRKEVQQTFGPDAQAVTVEVERGNAREHVLGAIEERDADLVIAGTTGKGGIERALLGSVSSGLLRHSPVPVLTVP